MNMNIQFEQSNKTITNSHLLNLLTKRSSKSVDNLHLSKSNKSKGDQWPGKYAPSLANISIKRNNHKSVTVQHNIPVKTLKPKETFYRTTATKLIKNMPLVKMGSTSLSLFPSARSKTIALSSTWRTNGNNQKFYPLNNNNNNNNQDLHMSQKQSNHHSRPQSKSNIIMTHPKSQAEVEISQFRNSRVCQIFKNQQLENYKKKSMIAMIQNFENQLHLENKNKEKHNVLNDYVIDYQAFNFIHKVIDNPEKWGKFVHKKVVKIDGNNNHGKEFMTAVPDKAKFNHAQVFK